MLLKSLDSATTFLAGDHTHLKELLHPANDKVDLPYSLAHARVLPGQSSLPHCLLNDEVYYILGGKGKVYVNQEIAEMQKGDYVLIPANAEQYIENIGEEPLDFLCIVSPAWSEGIEVIY